MTNGVLYVMETAISGLVKIGKTLQFEDEMSSFERGGYCGLSGLKRHFAIEVDPYEEKFGLLCRVFDKSRISDTELFALDIEDVVQILSAFDGKSVYPADMDKSEVFVNANEKNDIKTLPNGKYYLRRSANGTDVNATLCVADGRLTIFKGAVCAEVSPNFKPTLARKKAPIKDGILMEDYEVSSVSSGAMVVIGNSASGWKEWKTADGCLIDLYRNPSRFIQPTLDGLL